mgnify:CR=1 FL=1
MEGEAVRDAAEALVDRVRLVVATPMAMPMVDRHQEAVAVARDAVVVVVVAEEVDEVVGEVDVVEGAEPNKAVQ